MSGTFHIGMIEVREFNGILSGSGKENTVITNLPGLTPDSLIAQNKLPALITFIGGDVTVSDLSVRMAEQPSWLGIQEMSLLLFSDYSADYMPAIQRIKADLKNIELQGLLQKDVAMWDGTIKDFPFHAFNGVKFASDVLALSKKTSRLRSNIDVSVSNSKFENFCRAIYVWGCKSGNINVGKEGSNIFTGNNQGCVVNENIGVTVKIENNEFTIPDYFWNGIDINSGETIFGTDPF